MISVFPFPSPLVEEGQDGGIAALLVPCAPSPCPSPARGEGTDT